MLDAATLCASLQMLDEELEVATTLSHVRHVRDKITTLIASVRREGLCEPSDAADVPGPLAAFCREIGLNTDGMQLTALLQLMRVKFAQARADASVSTEAINELCNAVGIARDQPMAEVVKVLRNRLTPDRPVPSRPRPEPLKVGTIEFRYGRSRITLREADTQNGLDLCAILECTPAIALSLQGINDE
jgi:hypothetical protein